MDNNIHSTFKSQINAIYYLAKKRPEKYKIQADYGKAYRLLEKRKDENDHWHTLRWFVKYTINVPKQLLEHNQS